MAQGRGLKLSRDSDRDSRHHHQQYSTVGGILPVAESNQAIEDWIVQSLTPHPTQYRSFRMEEGPGDS